MIARSLTTLIEKRFQSGKVIVLLGPRQVGKTTLIEELLKHKEYLFLNGDDPGVRTMLAEINTARIKNLLGNYTCVFVDEAQRIENIGLTLKIIHNQFKHVQVFVSGSSSFDVSNKVNEPLTGRKWEYQMFPISWEEFENHVGFLQSEQELENRLLFGMYPDVLNHPGDEINVLRNLVNSYLYSDLLAFYDIRKPEVLEKLVQALALQVGSEVNFTELAQILNVDKNTVSNYIHILEKGFVVFRLNSFSRNLRNEIKTNKKIYFYDNGVRNMLISNFNTLDLRNDKGALWENFLISERMKQIAYKQSLANTYFWRTKQQQEIDFVEEHSGQIFAYEFKWKLNKQTKLPSSFMEAYKAKSQIIHRDNFREFVVIDN